MEPDAAPASCTLTHVLHSQSSIFKIDKLSLIAGMRSLLKWPMTIDDRQPLTQLLMSKYAIFEQRQFLAWAQPGDGTCLGTSGRHSSLVYLKPVRLCILIAS
jgi:hypothetical protein